MKRKINSYNEKDFIPLNKRNHFINKININNKSLKYNFFNKVHNRNKISIILNFLDINEQMSLLKLNSIISKILINKYNLPFKSIIPLRQIKNNKNSIESKYSKILYNFRQIIDNNNIDKEEYQYIISFLLKNVNNNFIIFDKISDKIINNNDDKKDTINSEQSKELEFFFDFFSAIKFIKNINHIKFNFSDIDNKIDENILDKKLINKFYFLNFFQNINHLEINKIENSFGFINKLILFENNSINNVEKINLNNISIKIHNEELLNYDNYNSLCFPKITNIKYLFLYKVNLSIFCLNKIINENINIIKLVINNCSNNNVSLYDEKEYINNVNKNINNCKEIKYIEFNNNNFSMFLNNKIIYNIIELFFNIYNKIDFISCGYPFNINEKNEKENQIEIPNYLKECPDSIFSDNFNKYLTIKFSPSFSYHIKKNKRIIEISNYIQKENDTILNDLKYEKIKLNLYNLDNSSISNNIIKIMQKYYQKNITKYLQIFASFKNAELTPIYNKNNKNETYNSIEKFTIFFQNDEAIITLFGNHIIFSIISLFPNIKVISFKNVNFKNDGPKFRENFDDINECFKLVLFGNKNKDLALFKNKNYFLKDIRFNNCYFCNILITKDILNEIEKSIKSYLGKSIIRFSLIE